MRTILLSLLYFISASAFAVDALPTDRRNGLPNGDWRSVGVPGGVPNSYLKTVNTTLAAGSSISTINSAIQNCPSNQVVALAAGSYPGGGDITISKNGVTLRGATNANGTPASVFANTAIVMQKHGTPGNTDWGGLTGVNISSGLTAGSTSITLASPPTSQFVVGNSFVIDQLNDGVNVKASPGIGFVYRPNREYMFVANVTNISGNTINFTPPLVGRYWSLSQTPQAFAWSLTYGDTLQMAAVENFEQTTSPEPNVIAVRDTYGCYVKNCRITDWSTGGNAGVFMMWGLQSSIVWNLFHDGRAASSSAYAIYAMGSTYCAIEYNWFTNLSIAMPEVSLVASSVSYNYGQGPYPYSPTAWLAEYIFPHGGHSHDCLYEGNWIDAPVWLDAVYLGNTSDLTFAWNRVEGWAPPPMANNFQPWHLEQNQHNTTFLNNVGGHEGYSNGSGIWSIDPSVTGLIRTNNWDTDADGVPAAQTLAAGQTVSTSYRFPTPQYNILGPRVNSTATNTYSYTNWNPAGYRAGLGAFPPVASGADPSITVQPQDQTVDIGASPVFTVTATGTAPLSYFWKTNNVLAQAGSSASLTLNSVPAGFNQLAVTVLVTNTPNPSGVLSSIATLTVRTNPVIAVTGLPINFGDTATNTPIFRTFNLTNIGSGTLIGTVSASSPLAVTAGGSYSLTAGQYQTVTVRFIGTGHAQFDGTITCSGGGGATVTATALPWWVGTPGTTMWASNFTLPNMSPSFAWDVSSNLFSPFDNDPSPSAGGRALAGFHLNSASVITATWKVNATNASSHSWYIDVDSVPTHPYMIAAVVPTGAGFEDRPIPWRGTNTSGEQFLTNTWSLQPGDHRFDIRSRDANTTLMAITVNAPSPPLTPPVIWSVGNSTTGTSTR